MYKSKN